MTKSIDYKSRMREAMLSVVRQTLKDVADEGLPGAHHFYISFETQAAGVELSKWLIQKYPDEMTIVIQNWYDDFQVQKNFFQITLNFGNQAETMKIPFTALKTFVDPSVEFGLTFNEDSQTTKPIKTKEIKETKSEENELENQEHTSGDVIDINSFRKT